ncbi:GGDEF domain-containing protein [Pseudooctadecabacter jejudonensis]|uniref:Putative diguanylate cyclase YeaP n=1 Tax=Pseudooctadecabacter jejudonensis TaxID=1391910 RepID=A0A1Y5T8V7_9RHOB|nr:diguanylate cyclase [Pseudooctadecabacter jejudonensis]SLN58226.1 putative diguanylate cyclase YeaP [Pseudooctadecabacter jejudonensis]
MKLKRNDARWIILMDVLTSFVAIAALWGAVVWLTTVANNMAQNQSRALMQSKLETVSTDLSAVVRFIGFWDAAADWASLRDDQAVAANIGSTASERGPFDFVYILDSLGTPIYAFESGERVVGEFYTNYELVNVARAAVRTTPIEPYTTVSGFVMSEDRLAMMSAGRIQAMDPAATERELAPVLIGARWFTEQDIIKIGEAIGVDGLQVEYWNSVRRPGTIRTPLLDISDRAIAYVSWIAPRPGDVLFDAAKPVLLLLSLIIFAASFFVGRTAARQTSAIVKQMTLARTDSMTGLMNRNGLERRLSDPDVMDAIRLGHAAVIYFDLNSFKPLNDKFGHAAGDVALTMVGKRLVQSTRRGDLVARVGGDEFLAVVFDENATSAAEAYVQRIDQKMLDPIRYDGEDIRLSLSHGISVAHPNSTWEEIVREADVRMYEHKSTLKAARMPSAVA